MIHIIYLLFIGYFLLLAWKHRVLNEWVNLPRKVIHSPALQLLILFPTVYWMGGGSLAGKDVMFVAYLFMLVGYLFARIGGDE